MTGVAKPADKEDYRHHSEGGKSDHHQEYSRSGLTPGNRGEHSNLGDLPKPWDVFCHF